MTARSDLENHVDTRVQQRIHESRPTSRNGTVVRDHVPQEKGRSEALALANDLKPTEKKGKKQHSPLVVRLYNPE